MLQLWFESSVNSEGIETKSRNMTTYSKFESSVNSEGIETSTKVKGFYFSLRAV